ncbi:hypothetical protein DL768_000224 [Monosporascus sp. mg162]|nr:hypothetical protein DL768_000224 [Monosporascus sp. mg162]
MTGLINQSNNRINWEGECGADPMDDLDFSSLLALPLTTTYNDVDSTYLNQSSTPSVNFQDEVDAEEHIAFEDFIEEEYLDIEPQEQEELKDWAAIESQFWGPSWMEDEACLVTVNHELFATDRYFYRALDQATKVRSRTSAHRPEQTKPTRRRKKSAQPCSCDVCNEKFPRPREMRRHMRKHEKPLRCQRCPASKAEKRDLLRHYRVKHPGYAWNKLDTMVVVKPSSHRCIRRFGYNNLRLALRPVIREAVGSLSKAMRRRELMGQVVRSADLQGTGDDIDDGERNPDNATHDTAYDCARWWPGRGARWRGRGTRAAADAPTVGGPEEEAGRVRAILVRLCRNGPEIEPHCRNDEDESLKWQQVGEPHARGLDPASTWNRAERPQ